MIIEDEHKLLSFESVKMLIKKGESSTLEFKKSTAKLKNAAQTLCAFLNGRGGIVLIGVGDDQKICGLDVTDRTQQEVALTLHKFEPVPNIDVHYYQVNSNNKKIILLKAKPDKHSIPYTFDGRAYARNQSTTQLMSQNFYQQLLLERVNKPKHWDELTAVDVRINDLDHDEIIKTIKAGVKTNRIQVNIETDEIFEFLKKLQLIKSGDITNAAVVLFCKEIPTHYFQCLIRMARFKGTKKGDFIDSRREYGNAFHLLSEAESFIRRNTGISSRFESGNFQRIDEPEYPPEAIREALINAICHRDYTIEGGSD